MIRFCDPQLTGAAGQVSLVVRPSLVRRRQQRQGGKEGLCENALSPAPSGRLLLNPFGEIQ
jgi:hypothetical protein